MARGASATVQEKTELVDLIGQIKPADSAREGRFIDPIVLGVSASVPNATIDLLTEAFEKVNMTLIKQFHSFPSSRGV